MKRRGIRITTTVMSVTDSALVTVTRMDDGLHRLTGATYRSTSLTAGPTGESYAYQGCRSGSDDAVGNRVALTDTTGTTTYTYDAANRLTSIELPDSSVQTYTWDARGNLLSTGTFTTTYNAAGRMVRAESVDLTSVYTYTADGLRVQQAVDGTVTIFAWDWATGVPELLSDGDKRYLVGHDTLSWEGAGGWTYPAPDALGSVRLVTDGDGAVVDAREWSPYGVEVGTAQAGLGYTGEWWDGAMGLQYLRARWYDVQSGRFTTIDPSGAEQNLYVYTAASPVSGTDPSGLLGLRRVSGADPYGGLAVRDTPSLGGHILRRIPDGTLLAVDPDFPLPSTDPSSPVRLWYKIAAIDGEFVGTPLGPWAAMDYLGGIGPLQPTPSVPPALPTEPATGADSGNWVLPLDGPINYTSGYGYYDWASNTGATWSCRPEQRVLEYAECQAGILCLHNGWDMTSGTSRSVYAMGKGVVFEEVQDYANTVYLLKILHNVNGQDVEVQYTHINPEPGLTLNSTVQAGEKIGDYGAFGYDIQWPHLHLSFKRGKHGTLVDPAFYWPAGQVPSSFSYGNPMLPGP